MKKIVLSIVVLSSFMFLLACGNKTTTEESTTLAPTTLTTTLPITTIAPTTTNYTTIVNDEIYLVLISGIDTVEINSSWVDAGAKIVINDQEAAMTANGEVNLEVLDIYEITYQYTYLSTTYEITRYVIVTDQTPPELELNVGVDTVIVGNTWIDSGVTITDNSLEEIEVVISGEVDVLTPGTYQITYYATDSSENENSIIRFVTVIE